MKRGIFMTTVALVLTAAASALALDGAVLVGKWQLVEPAKDRDGNTCPFVGQQVEFTADGKMISANMPMPFRYKVNPSKEETAAARAKNPSLKEMEIMLAMPNPRQTDWSKAPIAYGVQIKGDQFTMKVSGYSPARYSRMK